MMLSLFSIKKIKMRISPSFLSICSILVLLSLSSVRAEDLPVIKIGVLCKMNIEECVEQWKPTAEYLEDHIKELRFEIVPLPYDQIYKYVYSGALDFILANPSFYVELEKEYGVNRIVTLKNRCPQGFRKTYGGVIFWLKDRKDITGWKDFKGKRFMAANEFSLGGWRSIWRELKERGINPYDDFTSLEFGTTHEDVVYAVLQGKVDAGSVRTDILEQMADEGEIRLEDFMMLENPDYSDELECAPFFCSTRLYPEWPMAKLKKTPDDLAEKVTIALLKMTPDLPAAISGRYAGWTIPLNYQPVHECLRFLKVGPYRDLGKIMAHDVIRTYWEWLLAIFLGAVGSGIFIIAILRLNRTIRESNERLKEEMAEHRKTDEALKQAKEIAEAATIAKSEFLANMSHEIRTPMNGVIAAAELVMNEPLPPKIKRYLKIIHTSAHSLLGLINDILDFSKIEAGKMNIDKRPFMLDEVLDRVVNLFFNNASEKGIELLVEIHPKTVRTLIGDPIRLQQILTNLVGNAVKFTENGGFILIAVKMTHCSDNDVTLEFHVQDTGVGIPPSYLMHLFQPFTQADGSDTRRYEGTGLGLSICKRLVEMMSGRIWVESTVGRGSTFYFTIDIEKQKDNMPRTFDPPEEMRRLKVLIVDDCNESLSLIARMISSFNFEAVKAGSGKEALEKIKESQHSSRPIGLAVVDWKMPEMDGLETVKKIKTNDTSDLPVIMMTAFGKELESEVAEETGICCFLTKPIYASTLYNAIMDIFGRKGEQKRFIPESLGTDARVYKNRLQGFRVLVVEDNPTNSEIAVAILESAGMIPDTANNGKVALEKISRMAYDAVLMDIQMPEMNGYEATRQIRNDPGMETLPIIAMTAHAMRGDEEKCIQAGMDGYISKPVQQLRLFQLLWRLLKNRRPGLHAKNVTDRDEIPVARISLPDRSEGLHVRESLAASGLEPEVYLKILKGFATNNHHAPVEIKQALSEKNIEKLRLLAHTLKGGASNIGAIQVMKTAAELEQRIEQHAPDSEISLLCDRLTGFLETVFVSIKNLTEQTPGASLISERAFSPDKGKKVAVDGAALIAFADALKRFDPNEIRERLKTLKEMVSYDQFSRIQRWIDNYDYDDALAYVKEMLPEEYREKEGQGG